MFENLVTYFEEPQEVGTPDSTDRIVPVARLLEAEIGIGPPVEFLRGDANSDGRVDIADAVTLLDYLFRGSSDLACADAGDSDDSGHLSVTDAVRLLRFLFSGETDLPDPGAILPGVDPTPDPLGCRREAE